MTPNPRNFLLAAMRLCDSIKKKAYITCELIFASNKSLFEFTFLKKSILIFVVKGGANLIVFNVCELTFVKFDQNFLFIVTVTKKRFLNRGKSKF